MPLVRSLVAALGVAAVPLAAQTAATPVGPMIGVTAPWMSGDTARFGLRLNVTGAWGYRPPTTAIGLDVPLPNATLGVFGGYESAQCVRTLLSGERSCSGALIGGVSLGRPLAVATLGSRATASIGVQTTAGFRDDMGTNHIRYVDSFSGIREQTWSESEGTLALTLPMALSFRARGITFTPSIAPGIEHSRRMRNVYMSSDGRSGRYVITDTHLLFGTGLSIDIQRLGLGIDLMQVVRAGVGGSNRTGIGIRWNRR